MSDTVKLVLWIAVAVVVIGIIVWLFVNAGRRREVEARRFEAGELRARVEERLPEVQGREDRASVTTAMAQDARAEAERTAAEAKQRAEEARRLEQQAEQHRTAAESARSEHAGLEREADRVDPDVRTDDEGYRLDDDGNRLPGQEDSPRRGDAPVAAGAAAAGAAGVGAATFAGNHEDDDEDDLADAENPFAPTGSIEESAAATREPDGDAADEPEEAASSRYQEPAWEPSDPGAGHSHPGARDEATADEAAHEQETSDENVGTEGTDGNDEATAATPATPDAGVGYAEDEPGDAGAHSDDTVDGDPVDEQTHDEETDQQTPGTAPAAREREPGADEDHVDVPALDDRDEVVAEGGTPTGDPGDHRGQPWATTPGQRGPEESDEPADEGTDVDMAPHSHESDEVDSVDEPVGSTSEEPRRQEAEPASDTAEAAYPDGDATERADTETERTEGTEGTEGTTEPAATAADRDDTAYGDGATDEATDAGAGDDTDQQAPASTGRRVSEFDEVVDGGFGLGSAAPIGDGAQPLGHAVKGTREGTTFLGPDDEGYDDNEPDVWFYNEEAARRAGFTKSGE